MQAASSWSRSLAPRCSLIAALAVRLRIRHLDPRLKRRTRAKRSAVAGPRIIWSTWAIRWIAWCQVWKIFSTATTMRTRERKTATRQRKASQKSQISWMARRESRGLQDTILLRRRIWWQSAHSRNSIQKLASIAHWTSSLWRLIQKFLLACKMWHLLRITRQVKYKSTRSAVKSRIVKQKVKIRRLLDKRQTIKTCSRRSSISQNSKTSWTHHKTSHSTSTSY